MDNRLRRRRQGERGSQSLEWVGLGTVIVMLFGAAARSADSLGPQVGSLLVDHLKHFVS